MTHFRYVNFRYERTEALRTVEFIMTGGFRRGTYFGSGGDGYPITGDVIEENIGGTVLQFGDATNTPTLRFRITAYSVTQDWLLGIALKPGDDSVETVPHTYASDGPFTALFAGCCRIANLNNGPNDDYRAASLIDFTPGAPPPDPQDENAPPVVALLPIITVAESAASTFAVPAIDPEGDTLRWRFATEAESLCTPPVPPGMTIASATGIITWNNTGLDQIKFWTTQVIVEDMAGDEVLSQTPVDFLLKIVADIGTPPVCELSGGSELCVQVGMPLAFTVIGTDVDPGATLEINTSGLPAGATMNPALPTSGASGILSNFNWTPTIDDLGVYVIQFSVTDNNGLQSFCSVTITVQEEACPEPPPEPPVPVIPITFSGCEIALKECLPCDDDPIINTSSERPDVDLFIGIVNFVGDPPLGWTWAQLGCKNVCYSSVSQQDADDCARRQAMECVYTTWRIPGNGPPRLYYNSQQTCSVPCGAGSFSAFIPAGQYVALTQKAANDAAYSAACKLARKLRMCITTASLPAGCFNESGYSFRIRATGGTPFLATNANIGSFPFECSIGPGSVVPYLWSITGGALPAGLDLNPCSGRITGVPTESGTFTFTVQIVDSNGNRSSRTFTLCIVEITTASPLTDAIVETAYSKQFALVPPAATGVTYAITSGALPDGLALSTSGLLSGTPTAGSAGDYTFDVTATVNETCP